MSGRTGIPTNAAAFSAASDDVFARIADRYDILCDLFSLGIHRIWKRHMVARIAAHPGDMLFDAASGTGDIPLRLLQLGAINGRKLWVTDTCPQMLAIAAQKLDRRDGIEIRRLDAEKLSEVAAELVDIYSISFGMKICRRDRAIAEAFRILKPGGKFFCLEAARIPLSLLHSAYLRFMDWCLPIVGRIATRGDSSAYDYLLRGVHEFPDQVTFARELEAAGFSGVRYKNLTFGIVALHEATKPLSPGAAKLAEINNEYR